MAGFVLTLQSLTLGVAGAKTPGARLLGQPEYNRCNRYDRYQN
jgi:hypothetical protein